MRRAVLAALGGVVLVALAACTTGAGAPDPETDSPTVPDSGAQDPVAAAADLLLTRYEFVRDGDYASACALSTPAFVADLAELVDVDSADCVEIHRAARANSDDYLATAAAQGRAGLTPFFYVPSAVSIDASKISSDDPDVAVASAGAVVSQDPREFEDGIGKTPGWLSGVIYVVRGDDGTWRLATPREG